MNVAVIGAGAIGLDHIASFQRHPNARVVAVAETNVERGRAAVQQFDVPTLVSNYGDALKLPGVDVISIALPTYLHTPAALAALQAGKHVLIEKPLAKNARDGARIFALARKQRRVVMVGQNQRFSRAAQAVRKLVADGALGEVYHAHARWQRQGGIPRIGSWFTQRRFAGGGCVYDIGVHVLDLALHLMDDFQPAAVSGRIFSKFGSRGLGDGTWGKSEIHPGKPFDVEDFCVALVKLKSGRTVQLDVSWASAIEEKDINGVQLFGTDGGATTNPPRFHRVTAGGVRSSNIRPRAAFVPDNRMVHFIDVVLGRAEPFVKPEQSLAVQRILDAIYVSSRTGREVRL